MTFACLYLSSPIFLSVPSHRSSLGTWCSDALRGLCKPRLGVVSFGTDSVALAPEKTVDWRG